jgi:hypothetical protein
MKKIIFTLAIASFALTSQAQIFVGGSVGFNTNGGKFKPESGDNTKSPRSTAFNISPTVGYQYSEKIAFGARINFDNNKTKVFGDKDRVTSTTTMGLELFGQYNFLEFNKVFVYADAGLGFSRSSGKTKEGSVSVKGNPTTSIGLNIKPVLGYNLNEHITLLAELQFMGFGFNTSVTKQEKVGKTTHSSFGFGVNANHVRDIAGLNIGMIYKL